MKWRFVFLFSFVALSGFCQSPGNANTSEERLVRQAVAGFADTWNSHDIKAFSMIFAEDADFTNVVGDGGHGRTELEKFYSKPFVTWFKNCHFVFTKEKVRFIRPDVAAVDAWWEMSGTVNSEGKQNPLRTGLLSFVMTKSGDKWFITVMHNLSLDD